MTQWSFVWMFAIRSVFNSIALYFQRNHDFIHIPTCLSYMVKMGFRASLSVTSCKLKSWSYQGELALIKKLQLNIFIKRPALSKIMPETIRPYSAAKETANGPSMLQLTTLLGCRLSFFCTEQNQVSWEKLFAVQERRMLYRILLCEQPKC